MRISGVEIDAMGAEIASLKENIGQPNL